MAEEVRQASATPISPEAPEVQPEPDNAVTTPMVFFRGASATELGEPSTSMEDSPDSTYPKDVTNPSKQEPNISNFRKQLIFQCDFSVAEIESLKSMYLSGKDLKHLDLDDLLKSPVLTPSYQVTKLQLLQTQLEASLLDHTKSLSAHNSLVNTVAITDNNFLKLSRDAEASIGAVDSEEKCAIANSTPVSVLNHLSTDLTEDLSDNGCASLFNDYALEPDTQKSNGTFSTDDESPGHNAVIKTNQLETPRSANNQESMKAKTSNGGGKRDDNNKEKTREEELKDVISVLRALEMANDKRTPRSEQTLEHNAEERKVCDQLVSNLSPAAAATATDRKDCTRKEFVHLDRNEESVIKSVNISFSQEKVKVITGRMKEDIHQAMKVTTGSETKEINSPEQEKELSEYSPINLDVNPLLSRELVALVSHRENEVDDVKTPEYLNQNNDEEILRKEGIYASEIGDTLPLDSYGAAPDILIQTDINSSLANDSKLTRICSQQKQRDIRQGLDTSTTDSDEVANYETDVFMNNSEGNRDFLEVKMREDSTKETAKIEATGIIGEKVTCDRNNCKTDSFVAIVDPSVNCQLDDVSPLRYYEELQLNREVRQIVSDSMNRETVLCQDKVNRGPDANVVNPLQDTMEKQSALIKGSSSKDENRVVKENLIEEGRKGPDSESIVVFESNSRQNGGTVENIDACVSISDSGEEVELKNSNFSFTDGMKEKTDTDRNGGNSTEMSSQAKMNDICKGFVRSIFEQGNKKADSHPHVDQISVNCRTETVSWSSHHDNKDDMNNVQFNTNTVRQIVNVSENDHTFLCPDKIGTDTNECVKNTIKTKSPVIDDGGFTDANVFADINPTKEERRNHKRDSKPETIVVLEENDNKIPGSVANKDVLVTITDSAVKGGYKNVSFNHKEGTNENSGTVMNVDKSEKSSSPLKLCGIYKRTVDESIRTVDGSVRTVDGSVRGSNYGMNEIDVNMNPDKTLKDHNEGEMKKDSQNGTTEMEAPEIIRRENTPFFGLDTWESNHEIVQTSVNRRTENTYSLFSYHNDEDNVQVNRENKQIASASDNGEAFPCPDNISKGSDEYVVDLNQPIYPVIEGGDFTDANSIADMNPTDEEERKGSDTKQISGPLEDTDGRVFVFKMAVTTCQTESAATLSPLQTLEKNNDSKERKSPKPFHMSTSTSSILTVKNNDVQPIGSIRITCQIKEDYPDSEQSIISQEKVDVFSSKFTPTDYCGSNAVDTFMGTSSPIDKTRIPGYHEAAQSIDFLKTTTTSINITECSSSPFNSIHPDSKQINDGDHRTNNNDVIVESAIQVKPISDVQPITSMQRNSLSVETEKEIQDVVCLKTSPCPQMIAGAPETVGTTNSPMDLETDARKTPEKSFKTFHADAISGLNGDDGSPCSTREETEKKRQMINRDEYNLEQRIMAADVVSASVNGVNVDVQASACGDVLKVCQKIQTQNIESGSKSVTSKDELASSHMACLPCTGDSPIGMPNQKGAENVEQDDSCDEFSESNDDSAKNCYFSGSPLLLPPSALIKPIPRTESSQIIRTENGREIFAKRVQFSQSSQKESTSFMMIKNICQVQQRKSRYGQMNVVETGLGNISARQYCTRETEETCFETDATIGNKVQQTSFIEGVDKNTSLTRQTDAVPNSKKCPKSIIKKVSILEPIKDQEEKEMIERNSNRKNNYKKASSSNSMSEKKTTTATKAHKGRSSGDTDYHEEILSGNYTESEKSDGKGDSCDKLSDESNSKTDIKNSQRASRKTKPNSIKCIYLTGGGGNKYRTSASSGYYKKVKKSKDLQTGSFESCQRTLAPVWISTRKISARRSQPLRPIFNSPISPPQEEKNLQRVIQRLSHPSGILASLEKLSTRKTSNSGFHPRCNSPETDGSLFSSNQREIFSLISDERIVTKDSLPSLKPDSLDSALSLVEENQEGRHVSFSSENQQGNSSGDLVVFPISYTDIPDQTEKTYPSSNPNEEFKMNGSSSNQGQLLQTLCNHFSNDGSQNDTAQAPKSKNAKYPIGLELNDLNRKKRQDLNRLSAPLIPPPPPPPPPPPIRIGSFQYCCKDQRTLPIPKTFGKEHQNFKSLRQLKALERSLKRETSKIPKPPQQVKFQPYIFTSLAPYYDTSLVRYMMENPNGSYPGYRSRQTALGLCDPAEDLRLDTFVLPQISAKSIKMIQDSYKKAKNPCDRRSPQKSSGAKKSILPAVSLNLTKRQLTFSDVPKLRKDLKEKGMLNAQNRINQDYERTKENFYRLDASSSDNSVLMNRMNIRASYFAYLQNTPGCRKAIYECTQKQRHK